MMKIKVCAKCQEKEAALKELSFGERLMWAATTEVDGRCTECQYVSLIEMN